MNLIKGNSLTIECVVYTDEAQTQIADLTGASLRLYVKKKDTDTDANALLNKPGAVSDPSAGQCYVVLTAAESNVLPYNKVVLEVVVKLSTGSYIRTGVVELNLLPNVGKTLF